MREFCQSVLGERVLKVRRGLHLTLQIAADQSRWGVPGRHTRYGVSFGFTAVVEASLSGTSDIICQNEWARNMAIG